ncbi:MAG: helix-turn-helix transcriptional regulator, partial [Chitinophagaceae bacterium]
MNSRKRKPYKKRIQKPFELSGTAKLIIEMLAEGMMYKEIAHELNLNQRLVEQKMEKVRKKYHCKNTTHL